MGKYIGEKGLEKIIGSKVRWNDKFGTLRKDEIGFYLDRVKFDNSYKNVESETSNSLDRTRYYLEDGAKITYVSKKKLLYTCRIKK
jgi:hypothetical protein